MRRIAVTTLAVFGIVAVLSSSWPVSAEETPPTRVGRVSYVGGRLGFHAAGETKWSAAAVNYPVATGGSFWTDPRSRAEIRVGAQTIALANDTQIEIIRLDQQVMQIAVPQGRIELHLRQLGDGNSVEIDIPRGGVWLLQPGIYDINAGSPDRSARIMVFEGSARFVGGAVDQGIKAGEAAVISGTDTLTATLERAAPDAFVQWCRSRAYREHRLAAPYYVSPSMTGFEELDTYGRWRSVAEYGEVWYPNSVPTGWAPYRYGHWTWLDPWGWNWVDAAPWGFAPSHYGRWAFIDDNWGWAPGAYVGAPVYAPALVAFLADPAAILARAARGPVVGWFPLGPGEVYRPSFTSDPNFVRAINAGSVAALAVDPATGAAAVANRRAATVVAQETFANTGRVRGAALPVSGSAVQSAAVATQPPARQPAAARAAATTAAGGVGTGGPGSAAATRGRGAAAASASGAAAATGAMSARSAARGRARLATPGRALRGGSVSAGGHSRAGRVAAPSARASRFAGGRGAHAGPSRGGASARSATPRAASAGVLHGGGGRGGGRGNGGGPRFSGGSGGPQGSGGAHGGGGGGSHAGGGAHGKGKGRS